jgi:hypothetical protein
LTIFVMVAARWRQGGDGGGRGEERYGDDPAMQTVPVMMPVLAGLRDGAQVHKHALYVTAVLLDNLR